MFPTFMRNTGMIRLSSALKMANYLQGNSLKNKTRLVLAWIEIRREELNANWKLAVNGEEVFKIDPLK